jgi:nucleoid DNA-binding protein
MKYRQEFVDYRSLIRDITERRNRRIRAYKGIGKRRFKTLSRVEVEGVMRAVFEEIVEKFRLGKAVSIYRFGRFSIVEATMAKRPRFEKGGKRDWFYVGRRIKFRLSQRCFRSINTEDVRHDTLHKYADKMKEDN